ncbi:hypothetical protein CCY99_00150 [Helicobacter sp. 16-1353]|uniref:DUF4006 family protein n=1 Tax=Helicobacter sp. 16-1353 TaxID=2004996 RepID=UPI000DCB533D|nr:DUF4006 family protein [Helicobacter sp. 16-1353]RAX55146.1 hypothetical protein CCY99_00150 [Helicobacter sp. 16-1353]
MNGGYFSLNGLVGFFIAVVLLLVIVVIFGISAVNVQKREATNYYNIDASQAKMIDSSNANYYELKTKE